jgi:ribonuclease HI
MRGVLYTDGASKGNPGPSGIGVILYDEYGNILDKHSEYIGHATNNIAEYMALKRGLQMAKAHNIQDLTAHSDSEVLVKHTNGEYNVKNKALVNHMGDIRGHIDEFDRFHIAHVRRHYNKEADSLANQAYIMQKGVEHIHDSL